MINFAHRGASGDYPENTLIAFKEGIRCGGRDTGRRCVCAGG